MGPGREGRKCGKAASSYFGKMGNKAFVSLRSSFAFDCKAHEDNLSFCYFCPHTLIFRIHGAV